MLANMKKRWKILTISLPSKKIDNLLMICGDFNARISSATSISGNEEDIMDNLENGEFLTSSYPTSTSYSTRSSMDAVSNSRGRKLIDMATSQNLKILNGAIIGKAQGAFTCATYNGLSVVDYFLASHELIPSISSLRVLEFSAISDHAPLLCTLNAPAISNLFNNHESVVVSDVKLGLK